MCLNQINSIRKRFFDNLECDVNIYHEIDIFRFKVDDWFIERFILTNKNGYKAISKAMVWFNQYKVYDRKDNYFPSEIYEIGNSDIFGRDKFGRMILWMNIYKK